MPLAALSATVLALAFYTGYKVVLHKEPAFIPFALCGYCRKPWKSEFDSASIKEILRSQLASRLAVDTEALQILGVPITIPGADDDKISILVKSTSPGIHGLLIDKDWNVSVETRYISKPTDNLDKLMAGASTAASKNDTNTEDGAKSEVSEQKVIVEGQFKALCGSNLDHNKHTVSTATIYFVATRDFYARDSTVAFKLAATTIGYQDDQGETCYLRII